LGVTLDYTKKALIGSLVVKKALSFRKKEQEQQQEHQRRRQW